MYQQIKLVSIVLYFWIFFFLEYFMAFLGYFFITILVQSNEKLVIYSRNIHNYETQYEKKNHFYYSGKFKIQ